MQTDTPAAPPLRDDQTTVSSRGVVEIEEASGLYRHYVRRAA